MKILHTEASLGWGGQEIRVLEEAKGMMGRGHAVRLVAPAQSRIYQEALTRDIPARALPIGRKNLAGLLALRADLRERPVDVVNTHSSTDTWLAACACATLARAPAIVRTRHISAPVSRGPFTRWLYARASRRVVTTGEALRRELIEQNGVPASRVVSIPTGIDLRRFEPGERRAARAALGLDPAARTIGIVATLRSWKGHLDLLEAMRALPVTNLLIVGDGPMRGVIEERIAALELGARVQLVGHQADTAPWFRALDVFCLPSYANEGVPQALMQAMAIGLPPVSTPVGGILEIVEHERTGLIVPPRDVAALAQALRRCLDDAALAARLGANARRFALEHCGAERMLERMEAVFAEAVDER